MSEASVHWRLDGSKKSVSRKLRGSGKGRGIGGVKEEQALVEGLNRDAMRSKSLDRADQSFEVDGFSGPCRASIIQFEKSTRGAGDDHLPGWLTLSAAGDVGANTPEGEDTETEEGAL